MTKTINLKELGELVASGPVGKAKLEKQARDIADLKESLDLMARRQRPYSVPVKGPDNEIKFGLIADTHIGSLYQRTDALRAFYAHCEREGIKDVLHAGDCIDGKGVYRGQEFELHPNARSWPEQRNMFADLAPKINGISTHFITGNHDRSWKNIVGLVVGPELEQARPDWHFVGEDIGTVTLKARGGFTFRVTLFHAGGSGAYALGYRMQKLIEALAGGQKPDMVAEGHFHKSIALPAYRNVYGIDCGAMQSQTPFMASRASAAHVGGWVITVILNDRRKLTSRVMAEWIGFFEPVSAF